MSPGLPRIHGHGPELIAEKHLPISPDAGLAKNRRPGGSQTYEGNKHNEKRSTEEKPKR